MWGQLNTSSSVKLLDRTFTKWWILVRTESESGKIKVPAYEPIIRPSGTCDPIRDADNEQSWRDKFLKGRLEPPSVVEPEDWQFSHPRLCYVSLVYSSLLFQTCDDSAHYWPRTLTALRLLTPGPKLSSIAVFYLFYSLLCLVMYLPLFIPPAVCTGF